MPDPNNLTFLDEQITFMAIPKCANTSLKLAVCKAWGLKAQYPNLNHYIAELVDSRTVIRNTDKYWITKQEKHFSVTIIRHPQARIASFMRDKVKKHHISALRMNINRDTPLNEAIHRICDTQDESCDQHVRSLSHELVLDGYIVPNYVARVESIEFDWIFLSEYVKHWCNRDLGKLPKVNVSSGPTLTFTRKQMMMLRDRYKNDFEYFDYEPGLGPF